MTKLTLSGKQNTSEYTLLQRRHLELASTIEKTKGNSKDLFNTLALLPGPVGKFASEMQVAVEIMKVFQGTSFASLKTQFNELADTVKGFLGIGGPKAEPTSASISGNGGVENASATKEQTQAIKEQNKELEKQHENFGNNASAVKQYTDAVNASNKVGGEHLNLIKGYNTVYADISKGYVNLTDAEKEQIVVEQKAIFTDLQKLGIDEKKIMSSKAVKNAKDGEIIIIDKTTGSIKTATEVEKLAANQTSIFTKASNALSNGLRAVGVSAEGAALAVGVLEAALAAIGIGLVIAGFVLLGEAIKKAWDYMTGFQGETKKNIATTEAFTAALKREEDALRLDIEAIDLSTRAMETRAQIAGASEEEIIKITEDGGKRKLQALREYDDLLYEEQKNAAKQEGLTNEQRKKLNDEINEKILKNGHQFCVLIGKYHNKKPYIASYKGENEIEVYGYGTIIID